MEYIAELLSVVPNAIADIKALIRNLEIKKCEEVAQKALTFKNVGEVRDLVRAEFNL